MDLSRLKEKSPEAVRSVIKYHRYRKGSNIIYPHDKNLYLYLLLDGKAEVYQYTAGGMFISLYNYSKNSCFGEIELFCPLAWRLLKAVRGLYLRKKLCSCGRPVIKNSALFCWNRCPVKLPKVPMPISETLL